MRRRRHPARAKLQREVLVLRKELQRLQWPDHVGYQCSVRVLPDPMAIDPIETTGIDSVLVGHRYYEVEIVDGDKKWTLVGPTVVATPRERAEYCVMHTSAGKVMEIVTTETITKVCK